MNKESPIYVDIHMLDFHTILGDFSILQVLSYVTLIQLWWIAIWGIAYIAIEYLSNKSKLRELYLYIGLLISVFLIIIGNPHLIKHL
jgi:hypothetical protein